MIASLVGPVGNFFNRIRQAAGVTDGGTSVTITGEYESYCLAVPAPDPVLVAIDARRHVTRTYTAYELTLEVSREFDGAILELVPLAVDARLIGEDFFCWAEDKVVELVKKALKTPPPLPRPQP